MITKIITILTKKDYTTLLKNLLSLSTLQLLNNFLPLLTMPYLLRILGAEKYGIISFSQAIMQYFINFTDYGFNLTATKNIAVNRENKNKVNKIFSNVMFIKIIIMLFSFLVLLFLCNIIDRFQKDILIHILTFGMVIGNVFTPNWFFQGLEKMSFITFVNIISKIFFTILVFIFIKNKFDYLLVPLFYTFGFTLSGILSLIIIFTKFNISLEFPNRKVIINQLKEGWHIFLSTFVLSLYTNTGTVILGLATSDKIVGFYSAGAKLINAVNRILYPIQQALFPFINRKLQISKQNGIFLLKKIIILVGSLTLLISLILFSFSEIFIKYILGNGFTESILVFKILSFILFFQSISLLFGIQGIISLGYKKVYTKIITIAFIINVILVFTFSNLFKQNGCAVAVLLSEIFISITTIKYFKKCTLKYNWRN